MIKKSLSHSYYYLCFSYTWFLHVYARTFKRLLYHPSFFIQMVAFYKLS